MRSSFRRLLPALLCVTCALPAGTALAKGGGEWVKKDKSGTVTIYNRDKPGSDLKELKAVGIINAPPWVCFNVVNDEGRYKEFMPYTDISKVLDRRKDGSKVTYQLIDAPFVSDRDYTLLIHNRSKRLPDGKIVYKKTWTGANHLGPKKKDGVVRVKTNDGYWIFEEHDGGKKTKATYYLFTDPGGALPSFVINAANGNAVPGIFEAIEEQAAGDRYRKMRPEVPGITPEPTTEATVSAPTQP
jgi:hypothetical protein